MTAGPWRCTYGTRCNCRKPCCLYHGAERGRRAGLDHFELGLGLALGLAGASDAARADYFEGPAILARCAGKTASSPPHSLAAVATA